MKNEQVNSGWQTQEKSHLHALDVSILIASSFFWAWYQLAILYSALFTPFNNMEFADLYRGIAFISTCASLFFWNKKQDLALKLLNSRRWEILFVGIACIGCGVTMFGAYVNSLLVISIGGTTTGSTAAYFLLAWSRMYSRRGSRSTASSITGAFALSFALALLVNTMNPIAAAIITSILPFFVVFILIGVQAMFYSAKKPDTDVSNALQDNPEVAFGANDVLMKSRNKADEKKASSINTLKTDDSQVKISLILTLALMIFGFGFGYDIYNAQQAPDAFFAITAGGLTGFVLFLTSFFKPSWLYGAFLSGMIIGLAGYILVPALGLGAQEDLCVKVLTTVGSVSFFSTFWTVLSDMTTITKTGSIAVFSRGLWRCYLGASLGYFFGIATQQLSSYLPVNETGLAAILGFLFVIGILLLFVGNQSVWQALKFNFSAGKQALSDEIRSQDKPVPVKERVKEIATIYKLTERESEILELLATGRSRPRIAKALFVSENTVNSHVKHIYRKMEVNNIQELLDFVL